MSGEKVRDLDAASFKEYLNSTKAPVLVDFWAPWCGPCRMIAPVIEEIAAEYQGRLQVAKLNVDENQAMAMDFEVRSVPSLLVFKNGQEVERIVGFKTKGDLKKVLDKHLA